jgi:hypothetical protein
MRNKIFHNKWIISLIIVSFLFVTGGCSTTTVMTNWNDLPKNKPIMITTKSGEQFRFDNWQFDKDSTVIGWMKSPPRKLPLDSITTISTIDESSQKVVHTSLIVIGSIGGVVLLIYIISAITGFHWGKT